MNNTLDKTNQTRPSGTPSAGELTMTPLSDTIKGMTQDTIIDTESTVPAVENHHMTEFGAVDDSEPVERGKETTTFWHVAYDDEEGDTWLIGAEMDTLTGIMNELDSIQDHDDRAGVSHDNPDHYYLVTQERTPWKRHDPETTV